MRSVIKLLRFSWPRWSTRVLDILALFGVMAGVPIAVWWQVPFLTWVWLYGMSRLFPAWLAWVAAFVLSAQLASLTGWSWGIALLLTATTVQLRYWTAWQPRSGRWLAEAVWGGVWVIGSFSSQTQVDWTRTLLLFTITFLVLTFLREKEAV